MMLPCPVNCFVLTKCNYFFASSSVLCQYLLLFYVKTGHLSVSAHVTWCCQVCIRSPHLDTPSLVKMTSNCHFLPRIAIKGGILVPLVTRSEVTVSFDNSSKMWDVTHPPRVDGKWQITRYELLCRQPPAWAKYPRKYTKGTNLLKYDHHSRYTKLFII